MEYNYKFNENNSINILKDLSEIDILSFFFYIKKNFAIYFQIDLPRPPGGVGSSSLDMFQVWASLGIWRVAWSHTATIDTPIWRSNVPQKLHQN